MAGAARGQNEPEEAPTPRAYGTETPVDPDPDAKYKLNTDSLNFSNIRDDQPIVKTRDQNRGEFDALNDVILHARQFTTADLEAHASKDVMPRDLMTEVRKDYQFQLMSFEGRLARLRRWPEPTEAVAAAKVKNVYEAWVWISPKRGPELVCVLLTELPPGLEPSLEFNPTKPVRFAGYYFKLMRYESAEANPKDPTRNQMRRAPLLIGRGISVIPEQGINVGNTWLEGFVPGILALIGVIAVVTLGLTWLFGRGDKTLRRELAARRGRNPFAQGAETGGESSGSPQVDLPPHDRHDTPA
ncbi:hypothetical protein FRUB_08580 [Fimbriiglobus ruber]|uniref:Uncharacterized protein n=1 Tax=Fimbriiglobus ruber TaxID=1908690 RepID=A0A225DIS0_9BACT|nr:hypothetical protein FRUB_08580 [Fimbriiglobus ruber]